MKSAYLSRLAALLAVGTALAAPASAEVVYRATGHVFTQPLPAPSDDGGPAASTPLVLAAPADAEYAYGADWNLVFAPSGGKAPYSVVLSAGAAPSGVTVADGTSLRLTGRTVNGTYGPFQATVTDAAGATKTATVASVVVTPPQSALRLAAGQAAYRFAKGADWSVPFAASGGAGPYAFTVPSGLQTEQDPASGLSVKGAGVAGVYSIPAIGVTDRAGATASSTPVSVTIGSDALLAASPSPATGFVVTPTSAPTKTVSVSNSGDLPTASTPTPSATGTFAIASTTCSAPLASGGSCDVSVKGVASADGALSGALSFVGMAGQVALSGTASGFARIASASPTSATVSIVNGTSPSTVVPITIVNDGGVATGPLSFAIYNETSATGTFTPSTWYSLSGGSCVSGQPLGVGASCTVGVVRTASSDDATSRTGGLHVVYGTATEKLVVPLSGTVTGFPVAGLTPPSATASISSTSSPGPSTTFTVKNNGTGTSGATTVTLSNTTDFAIQSGGTCAGQALAATATCTVLVSRIGTANDATTRSSTLTVSFAKGTSASATVSGTISNIAIPTCSASVSVGTVCSIGEGAGFLVRLTNGYGDVCDYGSNYNSTTKVCTVANSGLQTWNDGGSFYTANASSTTDGAANTATLTSNGGSLASHRAAGICRSFGAKWFLAARDQVGDVFSGGAQAFTADKQYWSSTESSNVNAWRVSISATGTATKTATSKNNTFNFRCMRSL